MLDDIMLYMSSSKYSNKKNKRYKNATTTIEYKTRKNQLINPKIIIANQLVVLRPLSLVFFVKSVKQVLLIIFNYIPPPIIAELKP